MNLWSRICALLRPRRYVWTVDFREHDHEPVDGENGYLDGVLMGVFDSRETALAYCRAPVLRRGEDDIAENFLTFVDWDGTVCESRPG